MAKYKIADSKSNKGNDQNKPIYELMYKWIIKTAVPRLNEFRSGFLTIGTEERNKHILLDFIEKIGYIIRSKLLLSHEYR